MGCIVGWEDGVLQWKVLYCNRLEALWAEKCVAIHRLYCDREVGWLGNEHVTIQSKLYRDRQWIG